jgi:hypothetical protein
MISVAELFQICVTAKGSVNTWGTTYCCELDVGHMCKVESPSSLDEKTFNIVLVLMARVGISTVQFWQCVFLYTHVALDISDNLDTVITEI